MTDLLTFGLALILLVISWLLETAAPPKVVGPSLRSPRKPRPRPKPRFTGNVIVLSEYKREIKSKTGGNPATA